MTEHGQIELRRWIQETASSSRPIEIDDVVGRAPTGIDQGVPEEVTEIAPPVIDELVQRTPRRADRSAVLVTVAVALVAIVALVLAIGSGGSSQVIDVADERDDATVVAGRVGVAEAFWEAVAAGERETALGYVDPAEVDSGFLALHGRAFTLDDQFDWYEVVGWRWRLGECTTSNAGPDTVECTISARNAWSDSLGLEPITGSYSLRFSEAGIVELRNPLGEFAGQWNADVFGVFEDWVRENHPADADIMFNFSVDVNDEILRLYELNTARFVDAQQGR